MKIMNVFTLVLMMGVAGCASKSADLNKPVPVSYGRIVEATPVQIEESFGSKPAMAYIVERNTGGTFKIVTDHTGIPQGSCVAISHVGEKTILDPVKADLCHPPASSPAHKMKKHPPLRKMSPCERARKRYLELPPGPKKQAAYRRMKSVCP